MADIPPDFVAHFGEFSTCWTIEAASDAAKEFARENFPVEGWMGVPEHFTTDWRPARDLCAQLADEGFNVCCKQAGRPGYGVWAGR
jgi:hypothetical protein